MTNEESLEQVGEYLYELAQRKNSEDSLQIDSNDPAFKGLEVTDIEDSLRVLDRVKAINFSHKTLTKDKFGVQISRYEVDVDDAILRDYLIATYGASYTIELRNDQFILVNGFFILKEFNAGSQSFEVFNYLYQNTNRFVTIEEAKKHCGFISRNFVDLRQDWGFKGVFGDLFTVVAQEKMLLRKRVSNKKFIELGYDKDLIDSYLYRLKPFFQD